MAAYHKLLADCNRSYISSDKAIRQCCQYAAKLKLTDTVETIQVMIVIHHLVMHVCQLAWIDAVATSFH